ncbi:hypothetical protein B0H10DRAFT_148674 [Mycena sp. CBHHK59/15]|nr:hypothetical protein B0H10DRAFT_148674 [Mycena sp. CBHHK59/15]
MVLKSSQLTSFRPINKRARPAEIGGLKANWKKAIIIPDARGRSSTSANARARGSSRSAMRTGTSSEGDYGGTFADDEPDSTIQAAQASKPSGSASRSGGTARMGIKLTPVAPVIGPEPTSRHKKPKAKNEDLPFAPQEFRDNLKLWQTLSLGYIVEWAGSTEDAFAAGPSHPGFNGAVERAWTRHFPDIEITPAVYSLVRRTSSSGLFHSDDSLYRLPVPSVTGAVKSGSVPSVIWQSSSRNVQRRRGRLGSSAPVSLLLNLKT